MTRAPRRSASMRGMGTCAAPARIHPAPPPTAHARWTVHTGLGPFLLSTSCLRGCRSSLCHGGCGGGPSGLPEHHLEVRSSPTREENQWTNTPGPVFGADSSGRCSVSILGCPGRTESPLSPVTSTLHPPPPRSLTPGTLHHLPNKPPAPKGAALGGTQDKARNI